MKNIVSVIIPNYNGAATIGKCLASVLASHYDNFEVIVVDDASQDDSIAVIEQYPCQLLRLAQNGGAALARNWGAQRAHGTLLFFTDADCLVRSDTLALAVGTLKSEGAGTIIGGTYTAMPYDRRFCSRFQSVFINYFETKQVPTTDYIATHALAISADLFHRHQGFAAGSLPILEDVEFSHRLRRAGCRLVMNPAIQVQHIFDYSMLRSLRNAFVKSKYWTCYAIRNRDLMADSGTASLGLKLDVCVCLVIGLLLLGYLLSAKTALLVPVFMFLAFNLYVNRGLLLAFHRAGGRGFAILATLYYLLPYPMAVGVGALAGLNLYFHSSGKSEGRR